jgi:acetyl-CoA carboxylase biotin carboxyl carrier protein
MTPLAVSVVNPTGRTEPAIWPDIRSRACICSRASTRARSDQLSEIEAHITGTVWKIEVAVGDSVEEGDTVVILESMKMEMPVEAEDAGVVKEILCAEGQSVSEGDTLVVLE